MFVRLITIVLVFLLLMTDRLGDPLLNINSDITEALNQVSRNEQKVDRVTRARIEQAYGKLPMRFEANQGQTAARVKFKARGAGYAVFLTSDEAIMQLHKATADQPVKSAALRMKLVGSNRSSRVSGIEKLQTTSNYFIGNDPAKWRRDVANYAGVRYDSVYPGIDLVWYGNQQRLEHDFLIAPGADPGLIKISFSGTEAMSIDGEGALVLRAGDEDLRLLKPLAYQESNGRRLTIACDYRIGRKDQVEFRLGDYDPKLPLVIDPVLVYSTYIGGIGGDSGLDIVVDGEGAAYIAGDTNSTDFPGPSPIQPAPREASTQGFVLKINPAGDAVVFGTWIGGTGASRPFAVAIDSEGNVYLAGATNSPDFPLQNPRQSSIGGLFDAFALKINSSGSALLYSTYIGGRGEDLALALASGGNGKVYLAGRTDSGDFPVVNAFQPARNGGGVSTSGDGGNSWDDIGRGLTGHVSSLAIAPGDSSTLYAGTGHGLFKSVDGGSSWTFLRGDQFNRIVRQVIVDPTTPDIVYAIWGSSLFKSADGGATWVQKPVDLNTMAINPARPSVLYAGTFDGLRISINGGNNWGAISIPPIGGGPSIGQVEAIAIDPVNPAIVYIGASQGIYKSIDGGANWSFAGNILQGRIVGIAISRSNPATIYAISNNSTLYKSVNAGADWSPLPALAIGISSFPWPLVVSSDDPDVVYIGSQNSGIFKSTDGGATWNTVNNGLHSSNIRALAIDHDSSGRIYAGSDGSTEAFVAALDATDSSFVYSSYLGGGGAELAMGIAVDSTGAAYVAGTTSSVNFPVVNAFQPAYAGMEDVFVAKVNVSGSALSWATFMGGNSRDNGNAIALSPTGEIFVGGVTTSSDFPIINAIQPSLNGPPDGFIARLKNDGSAVDFSTYLGGTQFDTIDGIAVDTAGNPYLTGITGSSDYPVVNAPQPTISGAGGTFIADDAFVTKLSSDGTSIVYSTYLGGHGSDWPRGISVDAGGNAYVTGFTTSSDFPTTPSPLRSQGSISEGFVTKLGESADLAIAITGTPNPVMRNRKLTYSLFVTNNGPDPAINVKVKDSLPAEAKLISIATSRGSCSGTREIVCALGDLPPGSGAQITIVVSPSGTGTVANLATITSASADRAPANNTARIETNVSLLPSIYGNITTTGGAGLGGVRVAVDGLGGTPAVTSDEGYYQVSQLAVGGDYKITPSLPGYVFNPSSRKINNLQGDRRADFGAVACNFTISPVRQSFPAAGGSGSITIASPDPQCAWTATSSVPWIRFTSAPAGTGSGTVTFTVEPATGARNGLITIGGNRFSVFQEFNACDTVTFNNAKILTLNGAQPGPLPNPTFFADDFNNDSVSDFLFNGNQPVPGLRIALSNSEGGYEESTMIYPIGARTMSAGNLNNDGVRDLAVITNEVSGRLLIFTGDGAGRFSAPIDIDTGPSPAGLAIADFNRDGRSDLAVGSLLSMEPNPGRYNLEIHLGDGAGGFTAPINFGFTGRSSSLFLQIETGDFNGDGNSDLAVMPGLDSPIIFTGDGAAGFTISSLTGATSAASMTLGDFNGDLKTDLAITLPSFSGGNFNPPTILIWISTPTGILQPAPSLNIERDGRLLSAADFNGDGKSDLILRRSSDLVVMSAIGDGQFADPVIYIPGGSPNAVALGDFKRDGRDLRTELFVLLPPPPFISASLERSHVAVLTSSTDGFDAPRVFNSLPPNIISGSSIKDMESGDLNGDGVLDLVISASGFSDAVILPGNGRGEFGPPVIVDDGVTFGSPRAIELRDFNHDGISDFAFLFDFNQRIVILLGNGQGGFTRAAELSTGIDPRDLVAADFNNDGNLDLVTEAQSGGLALFLGNGQGGFTESAAGIGGNLAAILFTTGDFNGDGNADIAYCNIFQEFTTEGLKVIFGNGQGGFTEPINVRTDFNVGFLSVADFNLDGRDDLAYARPLSGAIDSTVYVVLSNSDGGFAPPVGYQTALGTSNILSNDINGDGKLDLIVVANLDSSVSLLLGNGDGSFNQAASYRIAESPSLIKTGDFDENGNIDIAFVRSGSPDVGILLNRSICGPPGQ
jgi:uncharacterized repeat protein (TIGR01451 family)